jgi:molybdate transport system ATP-binding protein
VTIDFSASLRLGAFDYRAEFAAADEILVLFGHSGAGKSVTLQAIAGLLRPQEGRIALDGRVVFDSAARIDRPPQARNTGYVVQDLALFPHMTVAANVAFGVPDRSARDRRVRELLGTLQIAELAERKPRSLSGGQQQRVALARALARDARILLLDEPFSALDEALRSSLRQELLRLRAELGLTILFVTHDLREAHLLADRIAVFDGGRILQIDPRETVFRRPRSRRVAELTGVANILAGTVRSATAERVTVEVAGAALECVRPEGFACTPGTAVDIATRAERVILRRRVHDEPVANTVEATIVEEFAYGSTHTLRFRPNGSGPALEVELAARPYEVLHVATQKTWTLELPPEDLHVMAR